MELDISRGLLNTIGELRELVRVRDDELAQYKTSYVAAMNELTTLRQETEKFKIELRNMSELVMATSPDKKILQDS